MTTTVKSVTRQFTPRSLLDLDPKVAVVAVVTLVAYIVLIALYATGQIPASTLGAGVGPATVATVLGYLKTSSHRDLITAAEQGIEVAEQLAPVLEAAVPASKPVVAEAEEILSAIGLAPTEALPSTSTGTLTLSANGGGQ